MQSGTEEKVRIDFKVVKSLLDNFDEIARANGFQRREDALVHLMNQLVGKEK